MGQRIEIENQRIVGDSLIVSTNRSFTGTDGEGFASREAATESSTFPALLASDLFESDDRLARVFVHQNMVVATRTGGWETEASSAAAKVIGEFFLFYPAV